MTEKANSYLGLFIISPDKEDAIDDVKKDISSIIGDNTGSIVKDNMMGKKQLSYPIKKKDSGIYYEVNFTAPPEAVAKMMRLFRINTDILRTLIDKSE